MENHKCQMKNQIEIIYVFNIYPNWDLKTRAIISYLRIVVEHFWSQMSFCWRGIKWCQLWKLKYKLWKSKIIIRKSSKTMIFVHEQSWKGWSIVNLFLHAYMCRANLYHILHVDKICHLNIFTKQKSEYFYIYDF